MTKTNAANRTNWKKFLLALAIPLLASCGGAGSDADTNHGGSPNGPAPADVEGSLKRLGVPMDKGARIGSDGMPVAGDYAPLGDRATMWRTDELFSLGIAVPGAATQAAFQQFDDATSPTIMAAVNQPWAAAINGVVRAAAAADIDGDGREEVIVVSYQPGVTIASNPSGTTATDIKLSIIDDAMAPAPFSVASGPIAARTSVVGLAVAAADFDGDNKPDLAVGVSSLAQVPNPTTAAPMATVTRARLELMFLHNDNGVLTLDANATKVLIAGDTLASPESASIVLAPARLDADRASELAVVVNSATKVNGTLVRSAQQIVFDDAAAGYAQLAAGAIQTAGGPVMIGDVAAGDIDGDGLDEIVVGGVTASYENCNGPAGQATAAIAAVAFDDAAHAFAPLGSTQFTRKWGDCGSEQQYRVAIRWAPVRVLNADDDDRKEILVGDTLYDDFKSSVAWTRLGALPPGSFVPDRAAQVVLDATTASVAVMAVKHDDGSHGDDIAVYGQDLAAVTRFRPVAETSGDPIGFRATALPVNYTQPSSNQALAPVLLPVNVDDDSLEVRRAGDTHKLVFTQPVVIAALAAPPCQTGIGQNTDACATSYGVASHEGAGDQIDVSGSIGVSVGVHLEAPFIQTDFEAKETLTATATASIGKAYDLSQSVTYQTGALEDAVVFSTVPYDQYQYLVVSGAHTGDTITVSLPRKPVVLIAERGFYNDAVVDGGLKIDGQVFTHTPGSVASYADYTAVSQRKSAGTRVIEDGPKGVGQGSSSVTLSHTVGTDYSVGAALELGYTFELQATGGGVLGGFSVGASVTNSMTVTSGTSTTYSGTVGSIDAAHFADNFYEYGLYTYVQTDPATHQQFEVLNWWVQK